MEGYAASLTYLFAVGTVLGGVLMCVTVLTRLVTGVWLPASVDARVRSWSLWLVSAIALFAVIASLWYSDVLGFAPCPLCWFARTMMYPLAVIAPIAAWRKDQSAWAYILALSVTGMAITGYHHLYQMGIVSGTLCNAFEGGVSCAKRYVFEFGFVTMPLMAFISFAATALLGWLSRPVIASH